MTRKRILVPPQFRTVCSWNRAFVTASFSDFLHRNRSVPISIVPPTEPGPPGDLLDLIEDTLSSVDGVLLQGGNDINPSHYGQPNRAAEYTQEYRDSFERAVVEGALRQGLPIFGVCRGFQLLNVCCNGSLEQHLEQPRWLRHRILQRDGGEGHDTDLQHPVALNPGGVLRHLLRTENVTVNSSHHQGVVVVGSGFGIEAQAPDGLVEAIADESRRLIGVQWHPEADFSLPQYALPLQMWLHEWVARRG